MRIDDITFFTDLAAEMNAHPERFTVLGDADMVAALVMRRGGGSAFAVRLRFEELRCEEAAEVTADDADQADFFLDGPIEAWQAMFDDVRAHGAATGRQTINSLALLGDDIRLRGTDPMGIDKFSRFNQTLQEFLDGAARVGAGVG